MFIRITKSSVVFPLIYFSTSAVNSKQLSLDYLKLTQRDMTIEESSAPGVQKLSPLLLAYYSRDNLRRYIPGTIGQHHVKTNEVSEVSPVLEARAPCFCIQKSVRGYSKHDETPNHHLKIKNDCAWYKNCNGLSWRWWMMLSQPTSSAPMWVRLRKQFWHSMVVKTTFSNV